jgi:NAD(P)-dependent dehydrogenase (short-subunit alcohol dehydrogenase family)
MVARNNEKAVQAVREVVALTKETTSQQNVIPMTCDHLSLHSVRQFCHDMKAKLGSESRKEGSHVGIDVLCLNAAVFLGEDTEAEFTHDNLELTMQTNHFAPFLIASQLYDRINSGARVVVTSSGLHAISSTTFGDFKGVFDSETGKPQFGFEMLDGSSFDHKKCYSISKLCNVAFCLELNRRLQERNAIAVCFTPGLIPTSGLFRHQKRWHETCLKKEVVGMVETEDWGGILLAWMAISDKAGEEGGAYWRAPFGISKRGGKIPDDLFSAPVNDEAKDAENQRRLWEISAALTREMVGNGSIVG